MMINKHQRSSILITTALIAATVLSLSVIVHALLDDAEARLTVAKSQTKINGCSDSVKCSTSGLIRILGWKVATLTINNSNNNSN